MVNEIKESIKKQKQRTSNKKKGLKKKEGYPE